MARVVKKSHFYLPPTRLSMHKWKEPHLAYAFLAKAGPYLQTPEEWKAELAG